MDNKRQYLKQKLESHGGKWLGFKLGKNDEILVRIRRTARKYFYLIVGKYIAENKVIVRDSRGKECGIAIRFDKDSFSLAPILNDKQNKK